ncbi:hypothetical protein [Micromonospora sp. NPDC092111]|uniref:hypothetical protein n=1 Tax=Micromonospora sp. NPDC092111 TaxID=3364289 RepID=UPI0037FCA537
MPYPDGQPADVNTDPNIGDTSSTPEPTEPLDGDTVSVPRSAANAGPDTPTNATEESTAAPRSVAIRATREDRDFMNHFPYSK